MSPKQDAEPQAIPDMVRDLVRRAESKLEELETRRQHLRRRVQALRFLSTRSAENRGAERSDHFAPNRSGSSARDLGKLKTRLRRACRIALLESDKPQTAAEIYQRISTRGSLSFQSSTDPLQVLSAELELMAKECEIICHVLHGEKLWQRLSHE